MGLAKVCWYWQKMTILRRNFFAPKTLLLGDRPNPNKLYMDGQLNHLRVSFRQFPAPFGVSMETGGILTGKTLFSFVHIFLIFKIYQLSTNTAFPYETCHGENHVFPILTHESNKLCHWYLAFWLYLELSHFGLF